jgi:hypothetical protein
MSGEWVTWHCSECNITLPGSRVSDECVGCKLKAENSKLKEQLRWRKWPEEKPKESGRYLVLTDGSTGINEHVSYFSASLGWSTSDAGITYWRQIGPLPIGE